MEEEKDLEGQAVRGKEPLEHGHLDHQRTGEGNFPDSHSSSYQVQMADKDWAQGSGEPMGPARQAGLAGRRTRGKSCS